MKHYITITRSDYKELLDGGWKMTKASLYEPDHIRDGSRFVIVDFCPSYKCLYRIWPKTKESTNA